MSTPWSAPVSERWHSWWQQLAAVMLKEAKQVTRDPSSWIIAVVLPLTFLFLFGYGISLDTTVVKISLVREDSSEDGRAFAAALRLASVSSRTRS